MSRGAMSSNVEHQGGMGQCTGSVPAAVGGTQSRLPDVTPELFPFGPSSATKFYFLLFISYNLHAEKCTGLKRTVL